MGILHLPQNAAKFHEAADVREQFNQNENTSQLITALRHGQCDWWSSSSGVKQSISM